LGINLGIFPVVDPMNGSCGEILADCRKHFISVEVFPHSDCDAPGNPDLVKRKTSLNDNL
jgi:hypothetical protein